MRWLSLLVLLAAACDPCPTEIRYVQRVPPWNIVCLPVVNGAQTCAVFPTPPPAPDWVGGPADSMAAHGYPLRAVSVCRDTRITDTPFASLDPLSP